MEALRRGLTLRRVTGGGGAAGKMIVSLAKFKAHCAAYPEWGGEAMKLAAANAKAANHGKGHNRNKTHCKFGHPFAVHQRLNFDRAASSGNATCATSSDTRKAASLSLRC